jgi:hypothetical protein
VTSRVPAGNGGTMSPVLGNRTAGAAKKDPSRGGVNGRMTSWDVGYDHSSSTS